jgi:NAD(P)-dependent dehydrogenase (short-subunit alcohol dehydrogenase family)
MLKDLFSLEGKVALITGGSRGIGRMIAEGFLMQGAKVYLCSSQASACDAMAARLAAEGGRCLSLPQDLSTVEGCRALAARLGALEPRLDILVNNAGADWEAPFDDFPESQWDRVMDLNVKSPFFLTQALRPLLAAAGSKQKPSKVINIASVDGLRLNPEESYSYHTSKAGLIYLTRRMAKRLVADGIVVSCIAPGPFATDMNPGARDHPEETAKIVPLGRIGTDEDMAAAAIYLASRAGDYVVGATVPVDGGDALGT